MLSSHAILPFIEKGRSLRQYRLSTCLLSALSVAILSSCESGGSGVAGFDTGTARGINGTSLFVSYNGQELGDDGVYFATRDVGTSTNTRIRIANQGADSYTLQNFGIAGTNAEEFSTLVLDDLELGPAQILNLDIAFQPITDGEKSANFSVDFNLIKQASDDANALERSFYEGQSQLDDGQFRSAQNTFTEYLQGEPETVNKQRAAARIPVIAEANAYSSTYEPELFMEAMTLRDEEQYDQAIRKLEVFTTLYPDSHLADDAIYLTGYIQLQHLDDSKQALRSMQTLRTAHPDTTYYDTALYSEALAQIELGNNADAQSILLSLKKRHTGFDVLGIQLPKDTLLSRLWFKRAEQGLELV